MRDRKYSFFLLVACSAMIFSHCRKLTEVSAPVTSLSSQDIYTSDATAISAVTGIYSSLSSGSFAGGGGGGISLLAGLYADEFSLWSGSISTQEQAYYTDALNTSLPGAIGSEVWNGCYPLIFACNDAINDLPNSSSLTPAIRQQLLGESKFMRAFFYFYLVNFYGDVPLVLDSNYAVNARMSRTPAKQVYQQIVSDLKSAEQLLSSNYLDGTLVATTTQRVRPIKWAAFALLARTYLYMGDWADAESQSDSVIACGLYSLVPLTQVFLMNSNEAIWQLQPVLSFYTNSLDAPIFIIPSTGPSTTNSVYLSNNLLAVFEPNDTRRATWVDSVITAGTTFYFPYKFQVNTLNAPVSEYPMILRIGEQYLVRAEARAEQGNILGAQADLNLIRGRANLSGTTASTQPALLAAILHERQVELFTEMGNRWLDLKRLGDADSVMQIVAPEKGGTWSSYKQLFPLPLQDLLADGNLVQNAGY